MGSRDFEMDKLASNAIEHKESWKAASDALF